MTPYVELSSDGLATIHAPGATDGVTPGTYVAQAGIEGWESTPDLKTTSTERQTGDGAHDVAISEIRYSSRTLTCHLVCRGASRADVMARVLALKALCHRMVRVRVVDGSLDRWCDGRCRPESVATWSGRTCAVTLTVVCDRPALLSTTPCTGTMVPATGDGGGLVFDVAQDASARNSDTSNLTPFFSRSLSDATYWNVIDTTYVTQLADGWTHVELDNSAGTSAAFANMAPVVDSSLKLSTAYTVLCEMRNVNVTGDAAFGNITVDDDWKGQFASSSPDVSIVSDGATAISCVTRDSFDGCVTLNHGRVGLYSGAKVDFDLRLSLYEGTYAGSYVPYYERVNVLNWPLSFGSGAVRSGNVCTLTNSGTIPADVVITAAGDMPGGIAVTDTSTGRQLAYGQAVTWSGLTMDSRTRTATVQGVDVSRSLTARGFPTVPAGGSVTLSLQASGTGTVTATCHDTYI